VRRDVRWLKKRNWKSSVQTYSVLSFSLYVFRILALVVSECHFIGHTVDIVASWLIRVLHVTFFKPISLLCKLIPWSALDHTEKILETTCTQNEYWVYSRCDGKLHGLIMWLKEYVTVCSYEKVERRFFCNSLFIIRVNLLHP